MEATAIAGFVGRAAIGGIAKSITEQYLLPKIKNLSGTLRKSFHADDIPDVIAKYIENSYNKIGYMNTIVFKNQQKLLDELYIPITICSRKDDMQSESILIDDKAYNILNRYNKVLIVDLAGMGKSTVLKYLYLRAVEQNQGVPVFIELRKLSSKKTLLEYIVDELKPILKDDISKEAIQYLIEEGDFIFFLDGYDEITFSEKSDVTTDIEQFVSKAYKNTFIMSSRDENELTCFGQFQRFNIKQLTKNEAFQLIRKYDKNSELSEELIATLNNDGDLQILKEFLSNPLMVSLLYKAYIHKKTIPNKKPIFYRQVYDALFQDHDLSKGSCYEHEKKSKLDIEDFHKVLRTLGYISFFKYRKVEYEKQELIEIINECRNKVPELRFNTSDFLSDILKSVPLMCQDGTTIKWVHKSFQEYFAACYIKHDDINKSETIEKIAFSKKSKQNYNILDFFYDLDIRCIEDKVIYPVVKKYLEHVSENEKQGYTGLFLTELFIYEHIWFRVTLHEPVKMVSEKREYFSENVTRKNIGIKFAAENPELTFSVGGYSNENNYIVRRLLTAKKHELIKEQVVSLRDREVSKHIFKMFQDLDLINVDIDLKQLLKQNSFSSEDLNMFVPFYDFMYCREENTFFVKDECEKFVEKIEERLKNLEIIDNYDF